MLAVIIVVIFLALLALAAFLAYQKSLEYAPQSDYSAY